MKSENKEIKVNALKKINADVVKKVTSDIERIGGNVWTKEEKSRAYFPDWMNLEVASSVFAQPYNAYIDLVSGDFVCDVSKQGFENTNNDKTERDYWDMFKTLMIKELKG